MEKPFKAWKSAEIPKIALGSLEMQRKAKYTDVLIKKRLSTKSEINEY